MKTKTRNIILANGLLTIYYSILFYIAQSWYSNIPDTIERVFSSRFFMSMLYAAWVIVPVHFIVLFWLTYKRKVNAGEMILCLFLPIVLAALCFPARG
jgi:hypothetical protein